MTKPASVIPCLVLALTLAAQPSPDVPIPISGSITTAAPPVWKVIRRTPARIDLAVPAPARKPAQRMAKDNPKPIRPDSGSLAGMVITIEPFPDHDKALMRLAALAVERADASLVVISGFPAIERKSIAPLGNIGQERHESSQVPAPLVTAAIATGNVVLHFETVVDPGAPEALIAQAIGIAHRVSAPGGNADSAQRDLDKIGLMIRALSTQSPPDGGPRRSTRTPHSVLRREHGGFSFAHNGKGEIEVAAVDADHLIIANGSGYAFSTNAAQSFTSQGLPCGYNQCDSDPSIAVGKSGTLYFAYIGAPFASGGTIRRWTNSVSSASAVDQNFLLVNDAVNCPVDDPQPCFPDQEHIAADRRNAAAGGGDQLYVITSYAFNKVWNATLVCSSDSAAHWTKPPLFVETNVHMPRVSVGGDGSVYVAYESGSNMMLRKYSSCDSGLVEQPSIYPLPVATFVDLPCPAIAGLDRCNDGNVLASPTVAVDDLDPKHVYYAFATSTGAENEDVMVYDSTDGGQQFARSVKVNATAAGRRFMPWVSAYDGNAIVTWYDRRSATADAPDLTRFFGARAYVHGGSLVAGSDFDISTIDDPQCSKWPCAPRSTENATACKGSQLAGVCTADPPVPCPEAGCPTGQNCSGGFCVSNNATRCDYLVGCGGNAKCVVGGGCPKYGDYNGNAVFGGRLFSAWASATPPPTVATTTAFTDINVFGTTSIIPSNYVVRDWTNSDADHDNGIEPSTNDVFWYSSDVWNQSTNVEQSPVGGWIAGDPPIRNGDNFAFARISRRSPAAPDAPPAVIMVKFFVADYGASLPFTSIGNELVSLPPGTDSVVTPPHKWTVAEDASSHLCLAVEIDEGNDPVVEPGLLGNAPGPADPMITGDNNKAQRNLAETLTAVGMKSEWFAEVANHGDIKQALVLGIDAAPRLTGSVNVIGGESVALEPKTRLLAGEMRPGERRWVRIRIENAGDATGGEPVHVTVFGDRGPISGFSLRVVDRGLAAAGHANLIEWAGVLTRIAAIRRNRSALEAAKSLRTMLARERTSPDGYAGYVARNLKLMRRLVDAEPLGNDPFELQAALSDLMSTVQRKKGPTAIASAHQILTQRFDAWLTASPR